MVIQIVGGRLGAWPESHTFPNLAGRDLTVADPQIEKELTEVDIEAVCHEDLLPHPEIFTRFTGRLVAGKLGEFVFYRNWYYWSMKGRVPLAVAEKMYADPVGKKDVRCGGHCGCPPPRSQASCYMPDGKKVAASSEKEGLEHFAAFTEKRGNLQEAEKIRNDYYFSNDPSVGEAFVEVYHIDSQAGLNLFVRILKREGAL